MRRVLCVLSVCAACGGGAAAPDAQVAPIDAGPTRGYAMATSGEQFDGARGQRIFVTDVAEDADVMTIDAEWYGVPWYAFGAGVAPAPEWVAQMDVLARRAQGTGQPVFLRLALVDGQVLAPATAVDGAGNVVLVAQGSPCYDFSSEADAATRRAAYLAYVTWMVGELHPTWLDVAIDVNDFAGCGGTAWPALVEVSNAAVAAARAAGVIAFPSFDLAGPLDDLGGLVRDRYAVSAFPEAASPADVPPLTAPAGERLLIAATGWRATPAVVTAADGTCATALDGDADTQAAWLTRVLGDADAAGADLVSWTSDFDDLDAPVMTDCPCTFDSEWCIVRNYERSLAGSDPAAQAAAETAWKRGGTRGLRGYDGTPRAPTLDVWQAARAIPRK